MFEFRSNVKRKPYTRTNSMLKFPTSGGGVFIR